LHVQEKLGQYAMRTIGVSITLGIVVTLAAKGVDAFPFQVYGLIGGVILAAVSFAVAQVE
jgi:hypothetical protein